MTENDPIARQLLNQAQLISRLQRELDALANEYTDVVAGLISRLEDLEQINIRPGGTPTAWCWRTLGAAGREELWTQLNSWVEWIRCRYPLSRRIPSCWAEHPEVVEELTALWLAWVTAYESSDAPLTSAADWHDRWLPGVLHRLEHGAFSLDCGTQHRKRPEGAYANSPG